MTFISFDYSGLGEFKFDLNYNTPGLNTWSSDTLAFCGIWQFPKVAPQTLTTSYSGEKIGSARLYSQTASIQTCGD